MSISVGCWLIGWFVGWSVCHEKEGKLQFYAPTRAFVFLFLKITTNTFDLPFFVIINNGKFKNMNLEIIRKLVTHTNNKIFLCCAWIVSLFLIDILIAVSMFKLQYSRLCEFV